MTRRVVVTPRVGPIMVKRNVVQRTPQAQVSRHNPIPVRPTSKIVQTQSQKVVQSQSAIVSRKKPILKERPKTAPKVQHLSKPCTPESYEKVRSLKNVGAGKILVIVANGPSINEVELEALNNNSHIDILMINRPLPSIWPCKYWLFCDNSQFRLNEKTWDFYDNGVIINSVAVPRQKRNSLQFKNLHGYGFGRSMIEGIYIGCSSTYAAMQVAYWMAYEHVYIFGVDMNRDGLNGKIHYYGENPAVKFQRRVDKFEKESTYYSHAATILDDAERARFTFCSAYNPYDFVDKFRKADHRVVIPTIIEHSVRLGADVF